jgi:hypothetical protein
MLSENVSGASLRLFRDQNRGKGGEHDFYDLQEKIKRGKIELFKLNAPDCLS